MFDKKKRLQRIEEKLDALANRVALQTNMLVSVIETLDERRDAGDRQRRALSAYIDSVSGSLADMGAPPAFVQSFKDLLSPAGGPRPGKGGNHDA